MVHTTEVIAGLAMSKRTSGDLIYNPTTDREESVG
jgi:hypothetical protein